MKPKKDITRIEAAWKRELQDDYGIIVLVFSENELRLNTDDGVCRLAMERILEKKRELPPLTEQEQADIAAQIEEAKKTDPVWLKMHKGDKR